MEKVSHEELNCKAKHLELELDLDSLPHPDGFAGQTHNSLGLT